MIKSVRFLNGFPSRFTVLGVKRYSFNGRLNVIVGPNGSGKTTLLQTLAAVTGCGDGGWSDKNPEKLSYQIEFEWDSYPVFYQNCYDDSEKSFINSACFDNKKYFNSTGEKRIGLINELIDYLEDRFLTYKLKSSERPTLLLDEVDNHIGFAGQSFLWRDIFPILIKKYQLIVSSHSIFPLLLQKSNFLRKDNIISLRKNYSNLCLHELGRALNIYNQRQYK